jgi:CHAD domain-containing protein
MAYRLRKNCSVRECVQEIALEQIDKSISEINDRELDRHETVHQVRKRCKKIRGLIRLVRPQFEKTYKRVNVWYRDSARRLSRVRDAQSIIGTFEDLATHFQDQIDREAFSPIRERLAERRMQVARDEVGLQERLDEALDRLRQGRLQVAEWRLGDDGFDAITGGLKKTYARGRSAMQTAYNKPGTKNFHEWRKRAKYHWYHMRLLRRVWRDPMKARRDAASLLSDYLGDDHDLSILRKTLLNSPDKFGGSSTIQAAIGLIDRRQVELRILARSVGERVFAEKPKPFVRRLRCYWDAWQSETQSAPATEHASRLVTV